MSTPVVSISPVGFAILDALATYRFLTTLQMRRLGIAKDRGYLGQVLASLLKVERHPLSGERKPKEIGELDFGVRVGKGRLPRLYYLTKLGAETLELLSPERAPVRYPTRVVRFVSDYDHRVGCVDFHLMLTAWATANDSQVVAYRSYFDWSKRTANNRPRPATSLSLKDRNVEADALFRLRDAAGTERPFVFELHNGTEAGRILKKMDRLAQGIGDGSLNAALQYEKAVRILVVCEHREVAKRLATRADTLPYLRQYKPHFFVKPLADLAPDTLRQGWLSLDPQAAQRALY